MTAKALILAGYGLNCEEETQHAFSYNGIDGTIRHINDLIDNPKELEQYEILAVPGGFSYGDDTGSGNAFAQKMKLALWEDLVKFVGRDTLTIGICNGCQILSNLALIPALGGKYGERTVAVTYNESARYQCRWIDVKFNADNTSPWLQGIETMHIPVAHGEGRFMMEDKTLKAIQDKNLIAAQFVKPQSSLREVAGDEAIHPETQQNTRDGLPRQGSSAPPRNDAYDWELANGQFPYNPNGSIDDIAALTDESGKVLAIMPHPERGMFTWQRDDFAEQKDAAQRDGTPLPETADGMAIFENAAKYFGVEKKEAA